MRVTRKARVKKDMKARSHKRLELPCFWIYGWRRMNFVLLLVFFMLEEILNEKYLLLWCGRAADSELWGRIGREGLI